MTEIHRIPQDALMFELGNWREHSETCQVCTEAFKTITICRSFMPHKDTPEFTRRTRIWQRLASEVNKTIVIQ